MKTPKAAESAGSTPKQETLPSGFIIRDGEVITTPWGDIQEVACYEGITERDAVTDQCGWEIDALMMDRDGDIINSNRDERPLAFSNGIGVEIAVTLDPKEAARQLRKIANSLEKDGYPAPRHTITITAVQLPDYIRARFNKHEPGLFPELDADSLAGDLHA
jgi:hypothetical protein